MIDTFLSSLAIIAPAFAAGVIVLLSHIPLGREVVKRGIIFIDLAIAQMAGFGIILASTLGFTTEGWQLQAIALCSAITGAMMISLLEKFSGEFQEALIGISFVLAATASLMLLANNPHGGEHLQDLLSGQILWVSWNQLLAPAGVSMVILLLWLFKRPLVQGKLFYLFFAVAITQSVQLIGVYLVFSSLIMPAIATARLTDKTAIITGLLIGIAAYGSGLMVSLLGDLPSGAVIVWTMLAAALLGKLISTRL
jgi:zinc/manganese transport system permease protein